jgi:hypothetical protein
VPNKFLIRRKSKVKAEFRVVLFIALVFYAGSPPSFSEELRVLPAGSLEASQGKGGAVPVPYNGAVLISLGEDLRFFRGLEVEISPPPEWLSHQGSLVIAAYADLKRLPDDPPGTGAVWDIAGDRFLSAPLPGKMQIVYRIPLRGDHGMRDNPYTMVTPLLPPSSFPVLFRLLPAIKGIDTELGRMRFLFSARPILGDEGAVRISFRYPRQLPDRPFTLLIDNQVVKTPVEELLLKEGEHQLLILSDDYRNENRLFMVERARILDLSIDLQDPTPLLFFEAPEEAVVFLDNEPVERHMMPVPVEPGTHEVRFQVSDYSITRHIQVQRGKTYRIAVTVDVDLLESD